MAVPSYQQILEEAAGLAGISPGGPAPVPPPASMPNGNPVVQEAGNLWRAATGDQQALVNTVDPGLAFRPPKPPPDNAQVPDAAETPASLEMSGDQIEAAQTEDSVDRYFFGGMPHYRGPGVAVMPEGENPFTIGGPEGQAVFDEAFKNAPSRLSQALDEYAQVEDAASTERKNFYEAEQTRQQQANATLQARRQQNQHQLQIQQKQIDDAVQRYSNDLADTGKFWRNPGNILAALGAAIMTLGSDDHAIGIKIINGAINADMNNRRQLANMHLGELRSNLAAYRQLAGDQEAGDLLAESEAKRIAAMELDRISAQFQGPLAKKKAQALKEQLMQDMAVKRAQFYNHYLYNKPQLVNPMIAKEYKKSGGFSPYSQEAANQPGAAGVPSGGSKAPSKPWNSMARQASGGAPTTVDKLTMDLVDKRAPGHGQLMEMYRNQIWEEAASKSRGRPQDFEKNVREIVEKDRTEAAAVAKELSPNFERIRAWSTFQRDVNLIESGAKAHGIKPDEWLTGMRDITGGKFGAYINSLRQKFGSNDEWLNASERFHQMLSGKVVDYYNQKGGGALTKEELENFAQFIRTNDSWGRIQGFTNQMSQNAGAAMQSKMILANPRVQTRIMIRMGMQSPKVNSPGAEKKKK